MRDDPKKVEGIYYNLSIYNDLLAEKTTDPAKKAELKSKAIADLKQAIASFRKSLLATQQQLDAAVQKTLVPVKYTLQVTPAS